MLGWFSFQPVPAYALVDAFFLYSFLGWVMECIVIRREKGVWENRGFTRLPFCVIYGFGAMMGFALLRPFSANYVALYLVGALLATAFEYITALAMLRLFGSLWWDYRAKPFNYKGILCLESTLGWGIIACLLFACLHRWVFAAVALLPPAAGQALAIGLVFAYGADFLLSVRRAQEAARNAGSPADREAVTK